MQQELTVKETARRDQILNGNLWKTVLILTIPLAIYKVFDYLYAFIDMLLVGDLNGSLINSVVFLDEIKQAVSAFGSSIAAAGTVIVARHYGAGEINLAKKNAGVSLTLSIVVSIAVVILTTIFGEPLLRIFGATDEIIADGLSYYNIQMITTGLIAVNSVFIGLEKAKGNTQIVLWLNLMVMIVKILLSVMWRYGYNGNLYHLALATLIAQGILTVIGFFIMTDKKNALHIGLKDISLKKLYVYPILVLSLPIFLGKFMFNMGKVLINGVALLYHPFAVGALGVASRIFGFFASIANVFEESEMSIISQNIGAKHVSRANKTFFVALVYSTTIAVVGFIISFFWKEWIIEFFNLTEEQKTVSLGIYNFEQFSLISSAVIAVISGMFIAHKKTKVVFTFNILRVIVFRLPLIYMLYYLYGEANRTYLHVGFVMLFSNTLTMIIAIITSLLYIRSLKIQGLALLERTDIKST